MGNGLRICLGIVALALTSCGVFTKTVYDSPLLVGKWTDGGGGIGSSSEKYTFGADGTGAFQIIGGWFGRSSESPFLWTADETAHTLTITYPLTDPAGYSYSIDHHLLNEKDDVLSLIPLTGTPIAYTYYRDDFQ
jgi:hypothetical protein